MPATAKWTLMFTADGFWMGTGKAREIGGF